MSWLNRFKCKSRKVMVIGLDCAAPELVFEKLSDQMPNLHALMRTGAYGRLKSIIPPITVPAWACMMTGKDPGTLGVYGFRLRKDYSYEGLTIATSRAIHEKAVWDYLSEAGRQCILVGVPPSYPPKPVNGCLISCFLTPGPQSPFTHPPELKAEIERLVGEYLFDVRDFRTDDKEYLRRQIFEMTKQHFEVVKYLVKNKPWDFFMFVEMGPDRLHHGFWKYCDPEHIKYQPGNPYENVFSEYYHSLDDKIGELLELVGDDTIVIVVSDHGAQRMDGGICINEWLIQEGYLKLKRKPEGVVRLSEAEIDWEKTVAWGEGGYYGRLFLNVQGREPCGVVPPSEYESVRDELIRKLEALGDENGHPIGTRVYRPEELYPVVRGIPPDLIVLFGNLRWRSAGSIGFDTVWVHENDTGPDDANHAMQGIFIASGIKGLRGELEGLHIMDIAETILELYGLPVPDDMEGHSIIAS